MLTLCSFLQSLHQFLKVFLEYVMSVAGRMYHTMAVIISGTMIVAVLTFTSSGFAGGVNTALTAYAETPSALDAATLDAAAGETALLTEAKIQFRLTDTEYLREGQLLAGSTLEKGIRNQQSARAEKKAAAEEAKVEIRRIEEERARIAAEEAARMAEEERIRQQTEALRAAAVVSFSEKDYEVLKRIVQAEAGICDMKGKILVANVIINRVKNPEFPDNITDVVYQRSQFSPVYDGSINTCKVTGETIEAVNRALTGEDYSRGALYFMNRHRSKSSNIRWFDGRLQFLFQHESHEFFK